VQRTMNTPLERASIHTYIQAMDFGNCELVKTEKGKCFRPEYISVNEPSFLERIADRRSECEEIAGITAN
jgi:hypothetical protein